MSGRVFVLTALLLAGCAQEIAIRDTGPRRDTGAPADADAGPADADPADAPAGDTDPADAVATDMGPLDAFVREDAAAPDAFAPDALAPDATPPDAGALDPRLALPDPAGQPCFFPGTQIDCPGLTICRFYTPAEGRCESCSPCGNLFAPCTRSADCDILFACFDGYCTNFCMLGEQQCGADVCVDIGHPTDGVCPPDP